MVGLLAVSLALLAVCFVFRNGLVITMKYEKPVVPEQDPAIKAKLEEEVKKYEADQGEFVQGLNSSIQEIQKLFVGEGDLDG